MEPVKKDLGLATTAPTAEMLREPSQVAISGSELNNVAHDINHIKVEHSITLNINNGEGSIVKNSEQDSDRLFRKACTLDEGGEVEEKVDVRVISSKSKGKGHEKKLCPEAISFRTSTFQHTGLGDAQTIGGPDNEGIGTTSSILEQENIPIGDMWPGKAVHTKPISDSGAGHHKDIEQIFSLSMESEDSYSSENLPDVERYSRLLMHHRLGYPLYCPEPNVAAEQKHREAGVSIGDIGHVTWLGEFEFAFNIHDSASFLTLSDSLMSLNLHSKDHQVGKKDFAPGVVFHSKGIDHEHSTRRHKVKCTISEGAFLVLPEGGILSHAKNKSSYKELAAHHAISWYKSIMKQMDVPNGALCLVTGCMKSKSWGIATFSEASNTDDALHFFSTFWRPNEYCWQPEKPEVTRRGPVSKDFPRHQLNQCSFIQGYRIMLRDDVHKNFQPRIKVISNEGGLSDASRKHQTPNPDVVDQNSIRPSGRSVQGSSSMTKCSTESQVKDLDPFNMINRILLRERPEARVALTHSDDLEYILTDHDYVLDTMSLSNRIRRCIKFDEEHACVGIVTKSLPVESSMTMEQLLHYEQYQGTQGIAPNASVQHPANTFGIQTIGQIALEIVNIAETARSNKADCKLIATQCSDLIDAVRVKAKNPGAEADFVFAEHVQTFVKHLQEICDIVKILAGRKWMSSLFHARDDALRVIRYRELLTRSIELFQVKLHVQIKAGIERLEANQSLSSKLNRGPLLKSPPPLAHFFGRDDVLREAVNAIISEEGVNILIFGPGGMGKTSLSLAILHNGAVAQRFNDNRFFLRCEAITNAVSLIDEILRCMGYRESVPSKDDDRMMLLYNCFGACGSLILVLDNFETAWVSSGKDREVLNILERITHSKAVTLIVTMRGNLFPDLRWYPLFSADGLPSLNAESARQVYLSIAPVPEKQIPLLDELLTELGYVPLAINLTAHAGLSQSPSVLLKRWRNEKTGFLRKYKGTDLPESVDVSIEVSLKVFQIKDELLRFFAFLACLTDGVYDWENNLGNMAPDIPNVYASIRILQSSSLIQVHDGGRLRILSPVRLYIKDHYGELCKQDMINLENYYLHSIEEVTEDDVPEKTRLLIQDSKNIMEIFEAALRDHPSQPLVQVSYCYSKLLYFYHQYNVEFAEQFVEACQSLMLERLLPHVIAHAGDVHLRVYSYVKADKHYTKAASLFKAQADEANTAQCFRILAFVSQRTYRYRESIELYDAAYEIFAKLNDESGMGQCLKGLGNVLEMMEDYAGALQKLKAAYEIFDKERYDLGKAQCIQSEGEVYCKMRDYSASKERLKVASKLYVCLDDQLGVAQCLQNLGNVLSLMGDHAGAMEELESAYKSFEAINEQLGQAQCLQTQGYVLRISGDYTAALEKLDAALKAFEKAGSQEERAQCLENMGHMLRANGKYEDARKRTDEAYKLYSKFGNKAGQAECLLNLAYVYMAMADLNTSAQLLTEGKGLFEQLQDEQGAAKCIRSLGDVYTGLGEYDKAAGYCEMSFNTCEKLQYWLGMALALRSWGKALLELGQLPLAWNKLETAYTMFDTLDDKLGMAHTNAHMANLLLRQNKRKEAKEQLDAALIVYESMSCEYGLRDCQTLLAKLRTA